MTVPRHDKHGTEFGDWIRNQTELDSYKGWRNYNLDYVWWLKKDMYTPLDPVNWMLLEEKRGFGTGKIPMRTDQKNTFKWLDKKILSTNDPTYKGFHLVQFENTNPEDGKMWLDDQEVTKEQLLKFLEFKEDWKIIAPKEEIKNTETILDEEPTFDNSKVNESVNPDEIPF